MHDNKTSSAVPALASLTMLLLLALSAPLQISRPGAHAWDAQGRRHPYADATHLCMCGRRGVEGVGAQIANP